VRPVLRRDKPLDGKLDDVNSYSKGKADKIQSCGQASREGCTIEAEAYFSLSGWTRIAE
jgi:hypothetical protein